MHDIERKLPNILFEIGTEVGFQVRTTEEYWKLICLKHPEVAHSLLEIKKGELIWQK